MLGRNDLSPKEISDLNYPLNETKRYDYYVAKNRDEILVIGLGFVGLTLSVFFGLRGKKVLGIETNLETIAKLKEGHAHFYENELSESLASVINQGYLELSNTIPPRKSEINRVYIITVGTPLLYGEISSIALENAISSVFSEIRSGDTIVIRSTVGIGMTRKLILNPLISMGLSVHVVVAPERTIEGVALNELATLPQIVGGDLAATKLVEEIFNDVGVEIVNIDDSPMATDADADSEKKLNTIEENENEETKTS